MKKNSLLLLGLFTPLLLGVCFATEDPHYEQLYNECSENYSALLQYNGAMSNDLNSCYESLSWLEYLYFNLYWVDNWNTYSIPLTNDVYLPVWYRAYVDSGVVAITNIQSLDYAYSLDDTDFQSNVVWSYSVVFLFLMSSGLFLIFLYAIRRYFIWFKSVK